MDGEPMTFIYALICPRTGRIRYVGKANDPIRRAKRHMDEALSDVVSLKNLYKARWLRLLISEGLSPALSILEECPRSRWKERERYWIAHYRAAGAALTNIRDGGEGSTADELAALAQLRRGKPRSAETRAKIGAARRAAYAREREANGGIILPRMQHTADTRARIAAANSGTVFSDERKRKISEAKKGRMPESSRRAIGDATRARWADPEARAALIAAKTKSPRVQANCGYCGQAISVKPREYAVGATGLNFCGHSCAAKYANRRRQP